MLACSCETLHTMTPSARISAAIDIFTELEQKPRPVNDALKDWALSRRYAGSGDRAGIGLLVHDTLRRRASARWLMGADTARAAVLGTLRLAQGYSAQTIAGWCDGGRFGPEPLSEAEMAALANGSLKDAPAHVRGDYPEWLSESFAAAFGDDAAAEGEALAMRAPLDLRVNTLKTIRMKALPALSDYDAVATLHSPDGIRVPNRADGRIKPVQADPLFIKGMVEIQDEGSQIVAMLCAPDACHQVLDYCAGGGGKTLALAALMNNKGQIFASDSDARRLAPIYDRLKRADARNVQIRTPRQGGPTVLDLSGKLDLVLIDAPCTGTGTWRRNPDAKWRMRPGALEQRMKEQVTVLDNAALAVKPGGRLAYITCSVLPEENDQQVREFLTRTPGFSIINLRETRAFAEIPSLASATRATQHGLMLTPLRTGCDGFYIAMMERVAN